MIIPKYLEPGNKIGIVAPARSVELPEIEACINFFKSFEIEALPGKNLFGKNNQFSGTDQQRADDINYFLNSSETRAIICARGGYGCIRTAQFVDWQLLKNNPQWIVGYSDITVFHSIAGNMGIESLHAPMAFNIANPFFDEQSKLLTAKCLMGHKPFYSFAAHPLNIQGMAKGRLTGGNLSVLYSLRATDYDIDTREKILFIEDIDEYLYHIDRIMMNFRNGRLLNCLRGIIVGGMTDIKDNNVPFGKDAYQIIYEHASELGIPVCFDFPAGHGTKNLPLIFGREVVLEVEKTCSLKFYNE